MQAGRFGFRLSRWLGRLVNLAGLPGFVRPGTYQSAYGNVAVRISALFTVVTVDGFEIFFYRLSGKIDGVSVTANRRYTEEQIPVLVRGSEGNAPE